MREREKDKSNGIILLKEGYRTRFIADICFALIQYMSIMMFITTPETSDAYIPTIIFMIIAIGIFIYHSLQTFHTYMRYIDSKKASAIMVCFLLGTFLNSILMLLQRII